MSSDLRAPGSSRHDSTSPSESGSSDWLKHPAFLGGIVALATAWCLLISWRKWADLGADFGRELYIPWRLSQGALLYRDVDDFYGPLSQHANAVLFRIFGPGIMVLVTANLIVFAAILGAIFSTVRTGWNAVTATIASIMFVVVFGFSRAIGTGNFNYATPYNHEATHGLLVLLSLVLLGFRFLQRPSLIGALLGGGLFGLTLVLKPEFILAAAAVTAVTIAIRKMRGGSFPLRWLAVWLASAAWPTFTFAGYFSRYEPWPAAWSSACRAWINVVGTTRFVSEPAQIYYLGLDAIWTHLAEHGAATLAGIFIVATFVWGGKAADRLQRNRLGWLVAAALAIAVGVLSVVFKLHWLNVGKCLLGLTAIWLAIQVIAWVRSRKGEDLPVGALEMRLLLGVAAGAMMARMVLNGRVYQFGFYQAALAAVVVVAALVDEVPNWKSLSVAGRIAVRVAVGVLLFSGVGLFALQNFLLYQQVDFSIGEGRDRFLVYGPKLFPQGRVAANVIGELRKVGDGRQLLVLPEGFMLNYLARMRSPLPHFYYYSVVTADGREAQLVKTLAERPPEWVIVSNRDLTEYGITHWGERSGAGKDLLEWVAANYEPVGRVDGKPMELERDGMLVLSRRQR